MKLEFLYYETDQCCLLWHYMNYRVRTPPSVRCRFFTTKHNEANFLTRRWKKWWFYVWFNQNQTNPVNLNQQTYVTNSFVNVICRTLVIWALVEQFSSCVFQIVVGGRKWGVSQRIVSFSSFKWQHYVGDKKFFLHIWWSVLLCLCVFIWTTADLCCFCVPVNTRTTLRRNTETKRSWSMGTAAQKSTETNTKKRGEKRRFVQE